MPMYDHALVFDTNIFNRMIAPGGAPYYEIVFHELQQKVIPQGHQFLGILTPALLLEYLGIVPEPPEQGAMSCAITADNARETPDIVFTAAEAHFRLLPSLQEANISAVYNRAEQLSSTFAKRLFGDLVGTKVARPGFSNYLIQSLALDYQYGYDFRSKVSKEKLLRIHTGFLLDVCRTIADDSNLSPARGLFEVSEELRKKDRTLGQVFKELLSMKKGLKLYGDRGDLDLIHLATMGAMVNNDRRPILVITGDPMSSVKKRLAGYKNLIHHFLDTVQKLPEEIRQQVPRLAAVGMLPGKVALFEQSRGTLSDILEVEEIVVVP